VWRDERGERNEECGETKEERGMRSVERGEKNEECGERKEERGMRSVER
jgi:hypothetical protein